MSDLTAEQVAFLGVYSDTMARQRAEARDRAVAKLTERERRLVREFAVMGFVHGRMAAGEEPFPRDGAIFARVLDGMLSSIGKGFPVFRAIAAAPTPDKESPDAG